jgi:hypothetical protein
MKKISEISNSFPRSIGFLWKEIMGENLFSKTSPKSLDKDVLTIYVLSPNWAHHINAFRHDIMFNVNEKLGIKLKKIKILNSTFKKSYDESIGFYNEESESLEIIQERNVPDYIFKDVENQKIRERLIRVAAISLSKKK